MRVLHLNTHASGGSYEYAALLCAALAEQGIESRLLSKDSQPPSHRGMEAGDYCLRLHLRNWIKLTWCTFTQWLTGLTFRIGWRPCHLEWVL